MGRETTTGSHKGDSFARRPRRPCRTTAGATRLLAFFRPCRLALTPDIALTPGARCQAGQQHQARFRRFTLFADGWRDSVDPVVESAGGGCGRRLRNIGTLTTACEGRPGGRSGGLRQYLCVPVLGLTETGLDDAPNGHRRFVGYHYRHRKRRPATSKNDRRLQRTPARCCSSGWTLSALDQLARTRRPPGFIPA